MRAVLSIILLLAAWLGLAAPALAAAKPDLLILVSIDGLRFDYLTHGRTPTLTGLAGEGVSAAMRPSFPSLTFPNHYTLVTGLRPDRHGIVDNVMDDPVLGHFTMKNSTDPRWWNGGKPLWITADDQGLKTATLFWPGSDREIRGHRPDHWMAYDMAFGPDQRVDQVLAWLDLPEGERPSFVTLYFDAVDEAGHHDGPLSAGLDEALAATDAAVARLVEGLKARGLYPRTNLIVTADHGMADVSAERLIYLDDAVPAAAIRLVTSGTNAGLSIAPGAPKGTLDKLLTLRGHVRCYRKGDLPKDLHYGHNRRVPPVFCLAEPGWFITTYDKQNAQKGPFEKGAHGYRPDTPEMAAAFVAEGPAFKRGVALAPFDNVDVEPLMADLLGLKAPKGDGSAQVFRPALAGH